MEPTRNPYREIAQRFEAAEKAELTRAEWEWLSGSFQESTRLWCENSKLRAELERVKRIGRRLWRSARRVRRQMWRELQLASRANDQIAREKVGHWSIDLGVALELDIHDAPPGHRLHSEYRQ